MSFDPYNHSLKIQEFTGTLIPKVGVHLGVWGFIPSHFLALPKTWNVTHGFILGPHLHKPLPWSWAQGQGCDKYIIGTRELIWKNPMNEKLSKRFSKHYKDCF
jgi:hypothetical protein